jgi:hypothetical protein
MEKGEGGADSKERAIDKVTMSHVLHIHAQECQDKTP